MHERALRRLQAVEKAAWKDDEFRYMYGEFQQQEARFSQLLNSLPETQKTMILDFIYYEGQVSNRLLELACIQE